MRLLILNFNNFEFLFSLGNLFSSCWWKQFSSIWNDYDSTHPYQFSCLSTNYRTNTTQINLVSTTNLYQAKYFHESLRNVPVKSTIKQDSLVLQQQIRLVTNLQYSWLENLKMFGVLKSLNHYHADTSHSEKAGWIVPYSRNGSKS